MRKAFLISFSLAVIGLGSYLYLPCSNEPVEDEAIGYFEQYVAMKSDANGNLPLGMSSLWKSDQKLMKSTSRFFESIRELGPTNVGGRTRVVKIDLADNNRLWAGGVSGGLWTSADQGVTWGPVNDQSQSLAVTCFTQNPFNTDVMYYGTGEIQGNSAGRGIKILYGDGIYKSTDHGKTFEFLESSNGEVFRSVWDIQHSRLDSNTIYVATHTAGLYRSRDGGETFERIILISSPVFRIQIQKDGTMFLASSRGIYKAHENDFNAVLMTDGLPNSGFYRTNVTFCESQSNVVYASFNTGNGGDNLLGIYRSNDTGSTWTELVNPDNATTLRFGQGSYNCLLGASPVDPNVVVLGAVDAVYTVNGGQSWKTLPSTHVDYHFVEFYPNTNNCMVGNDGGIYLHSFNNSSRSYSATDRNNGYRVTQFYAGTYYPEGDDLLGGTQDNGTWAGVNDNSGFLKIYGGDGSYCTIDEGGERLYYSTQNGNLRRQNLQTRVHNSLYNALSLVVGTQDFWFINPFEVNRADGAQLYFPTKRYVARTTNAGNNFELITDRIIGNNFAIAVSNAENPTIYFGGQSGILYRISNAKTAAPGDEFRFGQLGPVEYRSGFIGCIEIDPQGDSTIYLGLSNTSNTSRIWKVRRADTESPIWEPIGSNLPAGLPVNSIEVDPLNSQHIVIGTDFGLYTTVNGGGWWEKVEDIPNVSVHQLRLRESDRKLFIYTHGRGVWLGELANRPLQVRELEALQVQAYPNPVSGKLQLRGMQADRVELYSTSGKLLGALKVENGQMDLSDRSAGVYFLRAYNGDSSQTIKIVKE